MRTLVEQLQRNLDRDPGDAPVVDVQGDIDMQRMYDEAPTAVEPDYPFFFTAGSSAAEMPPATRPTSTAAAKGMNSTQTR